MPNTSAKKVMGITNHIIICLPKIYIIHIGLYMHMNISFKLHFPHNVPHKKSHKQSNKNLNTKRE